VPTYILLRGEAMSEQNHRVVLEKRNRLEIEGGVLHVHNFDSSRITVETSFGFLDLFGEGLNIEELNLEQGNMSVSGSFSGFIYSESRGVKGKGKGILKKMLK
jgi:sporulation protein YabP